MGGENDKKFKKLKCKDGYMQDVFAVAQDIVTKDDLEHMRKALKQARDDIDAKMAKRIIGFVGTAIVAGAATAAAFVFAPYIAPLIAGKAVAGLSGAALTSASLAFVGGGALAAGGLEWPVARRLSQEAERCLAPLVAPQHPRPWQR